MGRGANNMLYGDSLPLVSDLEIDNSTSVSEQVPAYKLSLLPAKECLKSSFYAQGIKNYFNQQLVARSEQPLTTPHDNQYNFLSGTNKNETFPEWIALQATTKEFKLKRRTKKILKDQEIELQKKLA